MLIYESFDINRYNNPIAILQTYICQESFRSVIHNHNCIISTVIPCFRTFYSIGVYKSYM